MSDYKGPISVSLVLLVAFFWGYAGEDLLQWWSAQQSSIKEEPAQSTQVEPPQVKQNLPPRPNPFQKPKQAARPVNTKPLATPQRLPGQSLAQTLDSISPGNIRDTQIKRRNDYFEKLNQQLKELQGDGPPPTSPNTFDTSEGAPQMPPGVGEIVDAVEPPISPEPTIPESDDELDYAQPDVAEPEYNPTGVAAPTNSAEVDEDLADVVDELIDSGLLE